KSWMRHHSSPGTSRGVFRISRSGYPLFRLTLLYAWMRFRLTMCLKFQLTRTSTRATVARAMCGASARMCARSHRPGCRQPRVPPPSRQRHRLEVRLRHSPDDHPHCFGSDREFTQGEFGQHQDELASYKCLNQALGRLAELVVFAASRTEVSV